MNIYYPDDESLSKTIVSEKVTLINKEIIMDKIQNKAWFVLGIVCAIIASYLILTVIFGDSGFLTWCWKLPLGIFATMAAVVFCDVGVNGDQPPR